jgi:glycosyltransferase involved in cell wall biosynthesis
VRKEGATTATPVAVHQFVPALIPRDATGTHTLLLRDALRSAGWRSEIFAEATHDELVGESIPVEGYPSRAEPGDVLVYQFSTSSMVAGLLADRPEPLVIDYHNVTGPEHYDRWEPHIAKRSADALDELAMLAPRAVLGLADSAFNERDLVAAGCRRTTVVPVLADHRWVGRPSDDDVSRRLLAMKGGGGADLLFVGRIVPSKAQHELVKALWAYRRLYDPRARLHLVGSTPSPTYVQALGDFVEELGLADQVFVHGEVTQGALASHFASADVFVSLSVHEGFGIPLIEAMAAGLPVVALGRGAVPGTVGAAALVLDRSEPLLVAAAVDRILGDDGLRSRLISAGRARAGEFSLERCAELAISAIATVAGPPPAERSLGGAGHGDASGVHPGVEQ